MFGPKFTLLSSAEPLGCHRRAGRLCPRSRLGGQLAGGWRGAGTKGLGRPVGWEHGREQHEARGTHGGVQGHVAAGGGAQQTRGRDLGVPLDPEFGLSATRVFSVWWV